MSDEKENILHDPLKYFDEILKPDERQKFFIGTLKDMHDALSEIKLNEDIPVDVRQMFETAKNASLYSYFVYRFHQVAEMVAFAALEFGLKKLCEKDLGPENIPKGLGGLLRHAKKRLWLGNDFFEDLRQATLVGIKAEWEKQAEKEKKKFGEIKTNPFREATEQELIEGIERAVAVDGLIHLIGKIRNDLAHGSATLHPNSIPSLRKTAEVINHIFKKQDIL